MIGSTAFARTVVLFGVTVVGAFLSCSDFGNEVPPRRFLSTDDELFRYFTLTEPLTSYTLFPRADSVTSGTLNGSTAHQPLVRVSLNAKAAGALPHDSLPAGTAFPNGSVVVKQIVTGGQTVLYAVILKDSLNPLAANGWLWAEFTPGGAAAFSIAGRGVGCVECHSREQGPRHDFLRTFERQR